MEIGDKINHQNATDRQVQKFRVGGAHGSTPRQALCCQLILYI